MRTKWYFEYLWMLVLISLFLVLSYNILLLTNENKVYADSNQKILPHEVTVILERIYLDGAVSQETLKEVIYKNSDFWAKYDSWQLIDMDDTKVVFRREENDISPLLKSNGYFGITEEGILTIFNGKPQYYNIIHSFFQIDIGRLESTKQEELKQGIPIKNKDRYVEVLETFKNYSNQQAN